MARLNNESFENIRHLIARIGFIERNGHRYSVVALAALLLVLRNDGCGISRRVAHNYRHRSRKLARKLNA